MLKWNEIQCSPTAWTSFQLNLSNVDLSNNMRKKKYLQSAIPERSKNIWVNLKWKKPSKKKVHYSEQTYRHILLPPQKFLILRTHGRQHVIWVHTDMHEIIQDIRKCCVSTCKIPKNARQSCEPIFDYNSVIKPMTGLFNYIIKINIIIISKMSWELLFVTMWTNIDNKKLLILSVNTLPDKNLTKIHASSGVSEWWYKCNHVSCDFFFFSTKKIVSANSVNFDK